MKNNFERTSFLFGSNGVFIEELYQLYLDNPNSVSSDWQQYFKETSGSSTKNLKCTASVIEKPEVEKLEARDVKEPIKYLEKYNHESGDITELLSLKARSMIDNFRERGHYLAKLDPLGLERVRSKFELKLNIEDFGFSESQLNLQISVMEEFSSLRECTLNQLVEILDKTYGSSIGAQFSHVENIDEKTWLFEQIENQNTYFNLTDEKRKLALQDLVEIEGFEQYLHTKFPGAKRFSIEGGDACIMALNSFIKLSVNQGVSDVVLGMAHRGRLCTLTKVMGKPYRAILSEFMGFSAFPNNLDVAGDVKYHMGYSADKIIDGKAIHLSLASNPSHLEAVNPVVAGKVRAKQDLIGDKERKTVMGILIHGDAAFCGQGVVAESLIMSSLDAYDVGGMLHIVINNQIGFTANAKDTRAGRYATEIAKIVGAPIIHVNGEDIEAVLLAVNIAANYRSKFGRDIVIDVICYRKYGHNEGDEPMYTQSTMYNIIKSKSTPGKIYADQLTNSKIINDSYFEELKTKFKGLLDGEYAEAKNYRAQAQWLEGRWNGFARFDSDPQPTGVSKSLLREIGISLCYTPENFILNLKLKKLFEQRIQTLNEELPVDWATAEQLAFASLLAEGIAIRLTGQDCSRGTFSHRHSVLHDQTNDNIYVPLNNISSERTKSQAEYFVADSNLSEYGVLGFEYGYSQVNPQHLVLWEAQFGDFANGAQIIFDQFISSAETKWLRMSGLVVLLPHGFEGQGPEHSSARLERFLQLAADNNMYITYPTTPASLFHMLRRQIYSKTRKPLIVMTPKSLLRHKLAVSNLDDMGTGTSFLPIIDELDNNMKPHNVKRVIFCCGKIYYDLIEMRVKNNISDIAIIRFEQLYPFAHELHAKILNKYKNVKEFVWCQEEPQNMGAWKYIKEYLKLSLENISVQQSLQYIGRNASASPAVGYLYVHNKEQEKIIKEALAI
ncbi:MAG: 2-oxoglutarate dehydrogenase E1 component [Janthinobacterium lividum]